jgi:phospholipid/cholesterol/gamma-HCH transport system substrate-binding protein
MRVQHIGPKIAAIAAFVILSLAVFLLLLKMAGVQLPLERHYTLTARLPDGLQLVSNADVRSSGVKIGRVVGIENRGSQAQVEMQLDDKVLPIYRDARVQIRTKTLVGENYIAVTPGTPRAGEMPSGTTLPVSRAGESVQLDDILSALDPATRGSIQRTVRSLGAGLDKRGGDLNTSLAALQPTFQDGGRLMSVLQAQREQLAALVDDAGTVMQAFGERSGAVRTLAVKLRTTAAAAASRDDEIRATLRELPPTLDQARGSVTRLGELSQIATPVVANLTSAATDLAPTVRELAPAARETRAMVKQLHKLLPDAEPLVRNLRTFATTSQPLAPALDAVLRQANPALAYLAPYHREFGAFFANVGSAVDTHDALGNVGRVHAVVSETSAAVWSPAMQKALNALIAVGGVSKIHSEGVNAYPEPGSVGEPAPPSGRYTRVGPDSRP